MITLSNGTQLKLVRVNAECVRVEVVPDDREMTESEWQEYCQLQTKRFKAARLGQSDKPSHFATVLP